MQMASNVSGFNEALYHKNIVSSTKKSLSLQKHYIFKTEGQIVYDLT